MRTPIYLLTAATIIAGSAAFAQSNQTGATSPAAKSSSASKPAASAASAQGDSASTWVAPGTKGSPIDGTTFHAQVLLDVAGFPSVVIDGKKGMNVTRAIKGFQEARGLKVTGTLDTPTRQALLQDTRASTVMVKLTPEQLEGPYVYPFPKKAENQAKEKFLGYRNMLERVAEQYHTTPETIVALNGPDKMIGPGQTLRLPNVVVDQTGYNTYGKSDAEKYFEQLNVKTGVKADHIVVDKSDGVMRVLDANDKLVAQFIVTTGSGHDPLPLGDWKVTTYSFLPPFNYQPNLFWDVSDDKAEEKLPPGPNGPVGLAWLDLTKEHYGIHGTGEPQTIGRAESHGCLRLTNWDVLRLSQMLKPGFKAEFVA